MTPKFTQVNPFPRTAHHHLDSGRTTALGALSPHPTHHRTVVSRIVCPRPFVKTHVNMDSSLLNALDDLRLDTPPSAIASLVPSNVTTARASGHHKPFFVFFLFVAASVSRLCLRAQRALCNHRLNDLCLLPHRCTSTNAPPSLHVHERFFSGPQCADFVSL